MNPQRQNTDRWSPGVEARRAGRNYLISMGFSFGGDEDILEPDRGSDCKTL